MLKGSSLTPGLDPLTFLLNLFIMWSGSAPVRSGGQGPGPWPVGEKIPVN